ncbi:MOSC domain-containing protein [Polynucleobacter sp. AP-Titi-500A-B4]|uniref:MOSC domain-containing protein n=1 Tax=Polynucleobacter sp. AP-Titi-500A-B4 TaxID=2576923 RepID=UPI00203DA4FF|nr:MOSC domain-containing protein [Polynucleobacter sp. AP-Titi-500A-B4]
MKASAYIQAIYIAPMAGAPMESVMDVELVASGIQGDRYASNKGAYSDTSPSKIRHISLITAAGIETANEWLMADNEPIFSGAETRRNVVLANMSADELNQLVGQTFYLGELLLKGVELCTPCQRPAQLQNKPNFMEAFEGRGGLRAEILQVGTISVGDVLQLNSKEA